jgi:quinol monooxygenase YgiN
MILILGTVRLAPARLDAARGAMERMVAASRAEPGCIAYNYAQDVLEPEIVHVIEKWSDREAVSFHFATPHMAEWRGVMGELGLNGRDLRIHEMDEGTPI